MSIDLHIHSTASDGSLAPAEILTLAQKLKLRAIAITDHDTLEGVKEASAFELPPRFQFLTGVEVSTQAPSGGPLSGSVHILGYGVDASHKPLNAVLRELQISRATRNPKIISKLQHIGIAITYEELAAAFEGVQIGRPHIAQLIKSKGVVSSINEAFDRFLGTGKPAYVDKYRVDCLTAINVIREAGGVPVLAHPGLLKLNEVEAASFVRYLTDNGMGGIEAYYPEHTPAQTTYYESIADRFNLLRTGGTDFHGAAVPHIQMGVGTGKFRVPYSIYETLIQALSIS